MKSVFKIDDKVYHYKYGWGIVYDIQKYTSHPIIVNFKDTNVQMEFTVAGQEELGEFPTLSFEEYDFISGGYTQERPLPKMGKGFKVTDENLKCTGFQYEIGKEFIHEGEIKLCESGFHFCKKLVNCFTYYTFNPKNRVFEIEHGKAIGDENDKMVTDRIKLVKELSWHEVLEMVNTGNYNYGTCNFGNYNSGDHNLGNYNSGNYNSGHSNAGNYNSGDHNSGDHNIGGLNSGGRNSGNYNSGYTNSGNHNSGNYNSGNWNSSNHNTGSYNSGDYNSGNRNSGSWNSGHYNSGYLNSETPKLRIFNKETDIPFEHINFPNWLDFEITEWRRYSSMTDQEREDNPNAKHTGGYLKTLDYKEAAQKSYAMASKEDQDLIEQVPNYDPNVLYEIFGIDRR